MRTFTVYRVDYVRKTKIPIGGVQERRKKDPGDAIHIAVDHQEARNTHQAIEEYSSATPPVLPVVSHSNE
jgi:hypothetical protein